MQSFYIRSCVKCNNIIAITRSISHQFRMYFSIYLFFLNSQKIAFFSLVYCLVLINHLFTPVQYKLQFKKFIYLCYSILSISNYEMYDVLLPNFLTNALNYLICFAKYFTLLMPYFQRMYNVLLKVISRIQYNRKHA